MALFALPGDAIAPAPAETTLGIGGMATAGLGWLDPLRRSDSDGLLGARP